MSTEYKVLRLSTKHLQSTSQYSVIRLRTRHFPVTYTASRPACTSSGVSSLSMSNHSFLNSMRVALPGGHVGRQGDGRVAQGDLRMAMRQILRRAVADAPRPMLQFLGVAAFGRQGAQRADGRRLGIARLVDLQRGERLLPSFPSLARPSSCSSVSWVLKSMASFSVSSTSVPSVPKTVSP